MGASLVALVLTHWTHVSDPAFRVLTRMAVTALDKPNKGRPAAVYLGGRELLAMTMRSNKGSPRTRNRAVQLALAELSQEGAIQHLKSGWTGQNAVYRLTLDRSRMGGATDHPEGGATHHPKGGANATKRVGLHTTPRNHEELQEERGEETGVDLRTTSHPPRATAADPENVIPFPSAKSSRHRIEGRAELAAKATQAREEIATRAAAREAKRTKEVN